MTSNTSKTEHIWVVTGPAGCGKTTVAKHLAKELSFPYVEGDDWHSPENKGKMANNIALTDENRWDWLITLREQAMIHLKTSNSVIVTCSALKQKYRDVIRIANYQRSTIKIHFIYLKVDEATLQKRVAERKGHYMKAEMVQSQMSALEEPEDEHDVLAVDVRDDVEAVLRAALDTVQKKLAESQQSTSKI